MKPAYKITVNGSDITNKIAGRLISLEIIDEAGIKSDRIELVLDDTGEVLAIPPLKAVVTAHIGYENALVNKGMFTIEEVELSNMPRQMIIRGNATEFSNGIAGARDQSWHQTNLGLIAKTIAERRKLQLSISPELAGIVYLHVDQTESDIQFLTRLAQENNAVVKVTHGKLVIAPHAKAKAVSGQTLPTLTINANDVTAWTSAVASRSDYSEVGVDTHDYQTGETSTAVSSNSGLDILNTDEHDADNNSTKVPYTYQDVNAASSVANAKRDSLKRGNRALSISSMVGNPAIQAEARVLVKGFRKGVDGDEWIVKVVSHRLNSSGYTCALECETKLEDA